jgi:hypothetical protein
MTSDVDRETSFTYLIDFLASSLKV